VLVQKNVTQSERFFDNHYNSDAGDRYMRKAFIVVIIVLIGIGGYLGWDWYDKTQKRQLEPSITLYYRTDSNGQKHISDSPPPENIKTVTTDKGYKHIRKPLVATIKDRAIDIYRSIRDKLVQSRQTKQK